MQGDGPKMAFKEHRYIESLIATLICHPLRSMGATLLIIALSLPGLFYLKDNFSYRVWFEEDNLELRKFDDFEKTFGSDGKVFLVIKSPSGIFDRESISLVSELTEKAKLVPQVMRVESLTNYNWIHSKAQDVFIEPLIPKNAETSESLLKERKVIALHHPIIQDLFISKDGTTTAIMNTLKPSLKSTPDYEPVVEGFQKLLDEVKSRGDHQFHLVGNPILTHQFKAVAILDMKRLLPFLVLLVCLTLFVFTKRLSAALLPICLVFLGVTSSIGFAGYLGIPINNLTAVLPQIILAIGVANTVHILISFFHGQKNGLNAKDSLVYSLRHNIRPTFLTSISTAIGFFSFSQAHVPPIGALGTLGGIGTGLTWLLALGVLAPLLVLLGKKDTPLSTEENRLHAIHPLAKESVQLIQRYRKTILWTFAVTAAFGAYLSTRIQVNSDPYKYFVASNPVREGLDFSETHLGGTWGPEIQIDSGVPNGIEDPKFLSKVETFKEWIRSHRFITKTISIVDIIKELNMVLSGGEKKDYRIPNSQEEVSQQLLLYSMNLPFGYDLKSQVSTRKDKLRMSLFWTLHESRRSVEFAKEIEEKAKELGLSVLVTGKNLLYQTMNDHVVEVFVRSITIAILLIGALLMIVFRSFKLGFLAMLPNVYPLFLGGAALVLFGFYLDIGTAVVASVCLGISVDDTTHVINHYFHEVESGRSREEAMGLVFTHTLPALCITTCVLVLGFGVLGFAHFVPNIHFGVMVAGIFSVALATDVVVLPALLLGKSAKKEKKRMGEQSERLVS